MPWKYYISMAFIYPSGSNIQIIRTKIEPLLISYIMKKEKGSRGKPRKPLSAPPFRFASCRSRHSLNAYKYK